MQLTDSFPKAFPLFTALSIYASVKTSQLSLPSPLLGHGLSILLPILTSIVVFHRFLPQVTSKTSFFSRQLIRMLALTILGLLDAVLLTLGSTLLTPELQTCSLETRWRALFQAHNVNAIRGIQDALNCCGLRTTLDQPWPWPDNHGARYCRENYRRERSCEVGWRAREVQVLTIWIVVGVGGLVIKVRPNVARLKAES